MVQPGSSNACPGCGRRPTGEQRHARSANGFASRALLASSPAFKPSQPAHGLQDDDIPGIVRYHTYEVLQKEVQNPRVR